jgi:lysozyme
MDVSSRGRAFLRAHEGEVLTGYLDPVGVPTIGTGATNRSKVATAYLKGLGVSKGRIVPGKTKLTKAQADQMFAAMLDQEYEPMVLARMPKGSVAQHQFDAATSAVYNLGGGAMNWRWAEAWRAGNVAEAARILANNYNTAGGRKLPGLVRRRKEEAKLFEHGIYTGVKEGEPRVATAEPPAEPDPVVKEAQDALKELGVDPGEVDGWMGPKTRAAIRRYQEMHPHLVNDGILGPATLSQLRRDIAALKDVVQKGGSAVAGSGALAWVIDLPWPWIAGGVAVAALIYFGWRYRDVLQRRFNGLTGRTVDV